MLRANFLFNFLKYKQNNGHDIVQYNSNENFELQDQINIKIIDIYHPPFYIYNYQTYILNYTCKAQI